jgi:hypothetical protein
MHEEENPFVEGKDHPGVTRVKQMWERGDFETLDKMVKFWEALENLGRLGDMIRRFIIWFGVIAGGYLAFSGWFTEWLKGLARQ